MECNSVCCRGLPIFDCIGIEISMYCSHMLLAFAAVERCCCARVVGFVAGNTSFFSIRSRDDGPPMPFADSEIVVKVHVQMSTFSQVAI